jgi:hypothetical protein
MPDGDANPLRYRVTEVEPAADAAPAICPECQRVVPADTLDSHLRTAHRVYQFRGARRSYNETLVVLLNALLGARPDPVAWRTLDAIAREEHGARADFFLAATLGRLLARIAPERRPALVDSLGRLLATHGSAHLAAALASDNEPAARLLALTTVGRMSPPLDKVLLQPLEALLLDRRLPADLQLDAVAVVLRGPDNEELATELLQRLTSGLGKARSIERLQQLEERVGKLPVIDALAGQLEERIRMTCPRCPAQLRRPEMVRHLWDEHRLVLDGRRVRDPWSVIDDWLDEYQESRNDELLERCRVAATKIDAQAPLRLQRIFLARGVEDPESLESLIEDAKSRHAAVCPSCYAAVPVPREEPVPALVQRTGRLSGRGYSVEVSERGLGTRLEVRTPTKLIYRGPDTTRRLTPRGALLLLAGPWVLAALVCAFAVPADFGPIWVVGPLLAVALVLGIVARAVWRGRKVPAGRLVALAWSMLVPRLNEDNFSADDVAFLAGLAQLSTEGRYADLREGLLPDLLRRTEALLTAGQVPAAHAAALRRLAVEDAVDAGEDPVPLVAQQVGRCFAGKLPLAFAERLLGEWETRWWSEGHLARLRVLACDRAFEAGFEVRNLLDAGETAPALGAVLGCHDPDGLAGLRLLWSLRPTRPWDRCGESVTVFELAAEPDNERLLAQRSDLLLWQEEPKWVISTDGGGRMGPAQILVTPDGVLLQGVLFRAPPRVFELTHKTLSFELLLGDKVFRSPDDLDALALRMERWFRYAFHEFLPRLPEVRGWQPPDRTALLRAWGAVPCPECRRYLLARVGELGTRVEDDKK